MSSKPGFWRKCRFAFRCARFTIWAVVLLALAAFGWFNVVGLPGFLKTRLVTALHERGVELEFSRMRWRIIHGFICDNVRIGAAQAPSGAVLTAREVQLRLNVPALLHRRWQVDGLVLHEGSFRLPLTPTNALALTNLQCELRFEADDTWALDQFRADLHGASLSLGAELNHAPEFRNWKLFSGTPTGDRGSVESALEHFARTLDQIHFAGQPQLNVRLNGDARDVHSLAISINARAPGVRTPWFNVENLQFTVRLSAPATAPTNCDPAWGFWTNLQPFRLDWTAHGTDLHFCDTAVTVADGSGIWNAPELAVTKLSARLAGGQCAATAKLNVATREAGFTLDSDFDLQALAGLLPRNLRERLAQACWTQPPQLHGGGSVLFPAWTNRMADWRDGLEPGVRLHGTLALTNALFADIVPLDSAWAQFSYSNFVWRVEDVALRQGRTTLQLSGEEDETTKNFHCTVGGKVDSKLVRDFLTDSNAVAGFALVTLREPVTILLDAAGNLRNLERLSATGRVVATDFAIRGQWVDRLATTLAYSNFIADFFHPQLSRAGGAEQFTAEKMSLDLVGEKLFIHNGEGNMSPVAVSKAIGPETAQDMEPYQFLAVPNGRVEGYIPLKQRNGELVTDDADLRVDIIGDVPFRWRKFSTPHITGTIHWLAKYLILTNVVAECYGGTAQGWGSFDMETPGAGTDFNFFMDGTNVDFHAMSQALWAPGYQLKGSLSGTVTVTRANSDDWRTWNGYGSAQLRNGLLWNAPIFGLITPVLNTLTPGLSVGSSRATDGAGRFTMTNGVIYTDSLDIRSQTMRIQYVGTVDLQQNVSARAKALLLRNTPLIGSVVSLVLSPFSKVFECEVTGTLEQPKITPIYIPFPKLLTAPLHPFRSLEGLFSAPATNSSPAKP